MQLALHGVSLLTSVAGEVGSFASMRPDRQGDFGSQTLPDKNQGTPGTWQEVRLLVGECGIAFGRRYCPLRGLNTLVPWWTF